MLTEPGNVRRSIASQRSYFSSVSSPARRDDAALGAEERLVGRAGDDVGALDERLLEVRTDQAEHVRHVVHEHGGDARRVQELAHLVDGLGVEHHALAEDDELGALLLEHVEERGHVRLVRVLAQHGDVDDRRELGARVARHVVAERAHRLGAQVAALADVVVDDLGDPPRLRLAVGPVEVVDERAEDGGVGHLAAHGAGLDLGTAEVGAQLAHQQPLHLVDEPGALVVEDVGVVEGLGLLVLGVAARGVGDAEQPRRRRRRHLAGDEVDALLLAPLVVGDRLAEQAQRLLAGLAAFELGELRRVVPDDGARAGRGVAAQVVRDDQPRDAPAAHVHLDLVVLEHAAVEVGQRDGAQLVLLGLERAEALAPRRPSKGRRSRWSPSRETSRRRSGRRLPRRARGRPRGRCRGRSRPPAV